MDGFFVAYEYGTGAAWAFVKAETADEVIAEVPELDVYDTPPEWIQSCRSSKSCSVCLS